MTSRLTPAIVAFALLLNAFPSQAQYAYNSAASAKEETVGVDPEEGAKAGADKLVHGVVQGKKGPLPGATVWLHGSRTIVVTNAEGEFELRVPATAKIVELTCGYGGLQEEVVRFASVQALGSVYLLRAKEESPSQPATK